MVLPKPGCEDVTPWDSQQNLREEKRGLGGLSGLEDGGSGTEMWGPEAGDTGFRRRSASARLFRPRRKWASG